MGLIAPGESPVLEPLTGGISSDIFRADLPRGSVCIKRALPKLKVAADWRAPTERNRYEVEWLRVAETILPDAVPAIVGEDAEARLFAMAWLDPSDHPVWKHQLRDGIVDAVTARDVGRRLALIHGGTADRSDLAERFDADHIFFPIRLEPYLQATARVHADCAPALERLVEVTASNKRALVHGDVSPKNILVGPRGPVFLDAECAWYGDPAFDLAFCLNHLLLKCVWRAQWTTRYLESFTTLFESYLAGVSWESPAAVEARVAHLLPGLSLARVDGKSPVEYIVDERDRDKVRKVARELLLRPVASLAMIRDAWGAECS
jgi:5-methylthioribose kinase